MNENNLSAENNQLILVNINEELVKLQVRESMKELDACECDTCFQNACALALNSLPSKYVTTTKGALLSRIKAMQLDPQAEIVAMVTKAVMQVIKNPSH